MTQTELDELFRQCPTLYHMAALGSWQSIHQHGLLSTSALLALWEIKAPEREAIETRHRRDSVVIKHSTLGRAVVRDQKPMDDAGLVRCLPSDLTPTDWYRILNARVFFWLTRARLNRLLTAKPYRELEHVVLELDTVALVEAYRPQITLSPINSGATKPFPAVRGHDTFLPISEYPYAYWRSRRPSGERVVELTVLDGVTNIARFTLRATTMRGERVVSVLFEKP